MLVVDGVDYVGVVVDVYGEDWFWFDLWFWFYVLVELVFSGMFIVYSYIDVVMCGVVFDVLFIVVVLVLFC